MMHSLLAKRLISFFVFASISMALSWVGLWLIGIILIESSNPLTGANYVIVGMLLLSPCILIPGSIITALLTLLVIDRALKANTLSLAHYALFIAATLVSTFIVFIISLISLVIIYSLLPASFRVIELS